MMQNRKFTKEHIGINCNILILSETEFLHFVSFVF